jgi:hypothetical protein
MPMAQPNGATVNLVFQAVDGSQNEERGSPMIRRTGRIVRWVVAERCDWQCS